jgi:hypothetical protein
MSDGKKLSQQPATAIKWPAPRFVPSATDQAKIDALKKLLRESK